MALFENTSDSEVTLDHLVGEGKKYRSPDELAKAYANASSAITEREQELANLREELNTRLSVEEQINKFQKATTQTQETQTTTQTSQNSAGEPDLAKRVRELIDQDRRETTQRANQQTVQDKLIELYGTPEKANQVVRQKAQELGVSVKFMEDVALQSPAAFFTQLGINQTQSQRPNTASRGDVNTAALSLNAGAPAEGTYEYFEEIRKTDLARYFDAKTQSRIHKAAMDGIYKVPDPVYDI